MRERHTALLVGAACILVAGALWGLAPGSVSQRVGGGSANRIVSLSPAMTEVLFALGAGDRLVGRTDYCGFPEAARLLPSGGSALTPNLEALVRMRPDLLLAEGSKSVARATLEKIGPTVLLPWTTAEEVASGIVALGELVGREEAAERLAGRIGAALPVPGEPRGPRVLLLVGMGGTSNTTFWFIKEDSLHGRALVAAGGRNAVTKEVSGAPSLGVEELLKLDPDVIIALIPDEVEAGAEQERYRKALERFGMLRAVKRGGLGFLVGSAHLSAGPRIIGFVESLRGELTRLEVKAGGS